MKTDSEINLEIIGVAIVFANYTHKLSNLGISLKNGNKDPNIVQDFKNAAKTLEDALLLCEIDSKVEKDFDNVDSIIEFVQSPQTATRMSLIIKKRYTEKHAKIYEFANIISMINIYSMSDDMKSVVNGVINTAKKMGNELKIPETIIDGFCKQNGIEQLIKYFKNNFNVNKKVFIVHGHDEALKEAVSRYLMKLDLEPIILHEQPNKNDTIIDKFMKYSDVSYAIVLLTPDDKGGLAKIKTEKYKFRARQNVIMELGYFLGKLGKEKVCVICDPKIEIPSDYTGIIYIPYDKNRAWESKLAKEIKASGLHIDMNKVTL